MLITPIVLFALSIIGIIVLMIALPGIRKANIIILISLFVLWSAMQLGKGQLLISGNKSKLGDISWWIPALAASMYQLTQAATRVPWGILSQKLNSRKKIIQLSSLVFIAGITIMVSTNNSTVGILIAAFTGGAYGATFGLDAQYWSENWNIKRAFVSSVIVFIIPFASSQFSNIFLNTGIKSINSHDGILIMELIAVGIGVVGLIYYTLFFNEDKGTICLDNKSKESKVFQNKTSQDILAISLAGAGIAFAYTFTDMILGSLMSSWLVSITRFVSLLGSAFVGLYLVKVVNPKFIRVVSNVLILTTGVVGGALLMNNELNQTYACVLLSLSALGFGMYVIALFGASLHFDHKFPALVLGIFLSVKSFAIGLGTLTGKIAVDAASSIGTVLIISVTLGLLLTELAIIYIWSYLRRNKKAGSVMELIELSVEYENNSNKQ